MIIRMSIAQITNFEKQNCMLMYWDIYLKCTEISILNIHILYM